MILRSLKSKSMIEIAMNLWEIFGLFGIPKIMQSDNGTEFVNELIEELVKLNGIDHRTISAYNPRANGAVERMNATIEKVLCKTVEGAMHTWPDYVPFIQLSCNAKTSTITGSTPFALMFGRRLNQFMKYGNALIQWRTRQAILNDEIYPGISSKVGKQKKKMAEKWTQTRKIVSDDHFISGATVMMLDSTRKSTWNPIFEGPFTIIRKNKGGAYILREKVDEVLTRYIPPDQLKLVMRSGDKTVIEPTSYKIDKITKHRTTRQGKFEYWVTWKDKSIGPGWEPVENFDDVNCIKKYWKTVRLTRSSRNNS